MWRMCGREEGFPTDWRMALLDRVKSMKENQKKRKRKLLFEVSYCLHDDKEECVCKPECQVPDDKKNKFLKGQRGPRMLKLITDNRPFTS